MRCHAVLFVSVSARHLQVVLVASVSLLLVPGFQRSADLATELSCWSLKPVMNGLSSFTVPL